MLAQLSLEIMLSMAFAIILATMCMSLYSNASRIISGTQAAAMQYANLSVQYSQQLLYSCLCASR